MRTILTTILAIALSGSAFAKSIDATVDGATLNISGEEVVKMLGAPSREEKLPPNECADGAKEVAMHYEGAVVTLTETPKGGYLVSVIDVNGPNRSVGGVRIGDTVEKVAAIFGAQAVKNDALVYPLGADDSMQAYEFMIKDGKVSSIKLNSTMC